MRIAARPQYRIEPTPRTAASSTMRTVTRSFDRGIREKFRRPGRRLESGDPGDAILAADLHFTAQERAVLDRDARRGDVAFDLGAGSQLNTVLSDDRALHRAPDHDAGRRDVGRNVRAGLDCDDVPLDLDGAVHAA